MLYKNLILVTITILLCLSGCNTSDPQPSINEAIDQIVYPHIALGSNVGIMVGTIKNDTKAIYTFGEKEIGSKEKLTQQSVFEIASATKIFTSVALAEMSLKGELSLDDPIEMYMPLNVHVPSFNGKKITLRHLANHTSGFPRSPSNADDDAYNMYVGYTKEKLYDFMSNYTLSAEPGTNYQYSNIGYGLLGYILSTKNNVDYETLITNRILQPLGMTHTAVTFSEQQLLMLAPGHYGSKKVESWSKYMQDIFQGAGALNSTMDDMLIYLEANMGKQNPLTEAMELSHTLTRLVPLRKNYQDGIGMGWNHYTTDGENIIYKNGGNGGYTCFIGFNKEEQTGVVILTNSSLNPDLFQTHMGFNILKKLKEF